MGERMELPKGMKWPKELTLECDCGQKFKIEAMPNGTWQVWENRPTAEVRLGICENGHLNEMPVPAGGVCGNGERN
jgi:hypothetical protein